MTTLAGTSVNLNASSLVITRPPTLMPGMDRGTDPVARMTLPPATRSSSTCTTFGATNRPRPLITLMLCESTSPCSPLCSRVTIVSLYPSTRSISTPSNEASIPMCTAERAVSATSAAWSSAFVGIHPRCRHVPPSSFSSIRITERPSSAARIAAAYPPEPPPRITTSALGEATGISSRVSGDHVSANPEANFAKALPGRL